MKIFVKAKPLSRTESVEKISEDSFVVSVKEPPSDGRANTAILEALAEYLNVPVSRVHLISGFSSKQKTFEVS